MKLVTLALLIGAALFAQSAAELRGYAWSADGRPIPQAKITLHSADSKADRTVTAGTDGAFDIPDLKPGRYEIAAQAAKQQLATDSATSVEVKAGEVAHTDLTLGLSTVHHGYWSRLVRRLDGLH
jgi:hypothetical protein